jgi:hypothetical protein
LFLHLDNPKTPVWDGLKAVDWIGTVTIVGGTLMLLLGLQFGGVTHPWSSATVICLIVFGILAIVLFGINEWKYAKYPIIPLRIFSKQSNVAAVGVSFSHGLVFLSGAYYLPLYFQSVLGATPVQSGVYLLPFALTFSCCLLVTGIFIKKTGRYLTPLYFGLILMILGWGLFIDLPDSKSWAKVVLYQIVAGLGTGPVFNAPLLALQAMVEPRDIATATSTFFFARVLSNAVSVVIGGTIFQNEMQKRSSTLIAALGIDVASELSGGSAAANVHLISQLPAAQQLIARTAFWQSLRIMWIVFASFAGVTLFAGHFIVQKKLSTQYLATKTGLIAEEENRQRLEKNKVGNKEDELEKGEGI